MTDRQKLNATLNFQNCTGEGGAVLETFFPWDLTVERFMEEGMPAACGLDFLQAEHMQRDERGLKQFFDTAMTEGVARFEEYLGFDKIRRMFLNPPFDHVAQHGCRPPVVTAEDWEAIKAEGNANIARFYTDENIARIYGPYTQGHQDGTFSVRFAIRGFFWVPRELFGIEEHMMALYDEPDLMHDIIAYLCDYYITYLDKVFAHVVPDVLYIMEDLSGANGPMISPPHFDEYIGAYYKKLVPFLKSRGVGHVLVDTDGDFKRLIPHFMDAGIEGFLPMDVNAGMDIVEVRKQFPTLKFIGAYNKLEIAKAREAIDAEFDRLLPVIRQGGYIPGADHQIAPSTSLEDYQYYIDRLREVMKQAGADR